MPQSNLLDSVSILDDENQIPPGEQPAISDSNIKLENPPGGLTSKFRLRLGFDALYIERSRPENTVFATEDNGSQFRFSDFDLTASDVRFFVQFMGDDDSGFELTFFDIDVFSSSINATGDNVAPVFFGLPVDGGASTDLNYTSRFKSIEINSWVRDSPTHRSGYGFRYYNLDESFNVLPGGSTARGLLSRTENDIWGLTRMWERRRPVFGALTLIGGVDAGLYLNRVNLDVDTPDVDDHSAANNLAGSLGFNISLEYKMARHVNLRLGYEGLGIFGVGTASSQSIDQEILNGLDDPELSSVFFGALFLGAVATF